MFYYFLMFLFFWFGSSPAHKTNVVYVAKFGSYMQHGKSVLFVLANTLHPDSGYNMENDIP